MIEEHSQVGGQGHWNIEGNQYLCEGTEKKRLYEGQAEIMYIFIHELLVYIHSWIGDNTNYKGHDW